MKNAPIKLTSYVSPASALLNLIACFVPIWIIFRPSLVELVLLIGVDSLALLINQPIELWIFQKIYPCTKVYLNGLPDERVAAMTESQRVQLVESFMRFPFRRALYAYAFSALKIVPGLLFMVFYWKHSSSNLQLCLTLLVFVSIYFSYFAGVIYVESHIFLSQRLEELHKKFDFSKIFRQTNVTYSRYEFESLQLLVCVFLAAFGVGLQVIIILTHQYDSTRSLALKIGVVAAASVVLFARIWYLERHYFTKGLERLVEELKTVDLNQNKVPLSLNTAPLLAQFEKEFNDLTQRLFISERKLASLIVTEAEKSRFRALGEISALIAHDLSGPLHAASFYSSSLIESPTTPKLVPYLYRVVENLARATELIQSLRARIKDTTLTAHAAVFAEAHQHVLRLLSLQFIKDDFERIEISLDPKLNDLVLHLASSDLLHVLDNLYRNSIENFLAHQIKNPLIKVTLKQWVSTDRVEIWIEDNGGGLSSERYEELTSYNSNRPMVNQVLDTALPAEAAPWTKNLGLGLRLTRRLVELNQGSLTVLPTPESFTGTLFSLQLRAQVDYDAARMSKVETNPDVIQ